MSNIMKPNSRFSVLMDEPIIEKKTEKENYYKDDNRKNNFSSFRSFEENEKQRLKDILDKKEFEEQKKMKELSNMDNFPELVVNLVTNQNNIVTTNYANKLKDENTVERVVEDPDLVDLKDGWILMKKDSLTGKIVRKHKNLNALENKIEKQEQLEKKIEKKLEKELENEEFKTDILILNSLVKLHVKRRQEYIDYYGYEEWEKMFKVPNWIEEEEYLEMMEAKCYESESDINSEEDESDYSYDN